jgi:ABC-2 type transport system permease protein
MVVDQDHSSVSRTLIRSIRATDSLSVKTETQNISDFFPAVQRGDIWGCVVIPRDFETDIDSGRQAKVLVFVDGGNVLNGNVIIKVMRTILATFRATRLGAGGSPSELALADAMPIQAEARPIFNPTYNYATFMLIGLACIALQQCTLMGAAAGLWSVKIEPKKTGWIASFSLFMGKTAAHLLIMLLVSTLVLALPFIAFGSAFHGDWRLLAVGVVMATFINVWCGFGFVALVKDLSLTMSLMLCASVPVFLVTGYTWPLFVEPKPYQFVAHMLPLTHYWEIARCVALKSASLDSMAPHLVALAAWLPFTFLFGWWAVFKKAKDA